MDTDSAYMAVSGPLEDIVIPEKRLEFFTNFHRWFPQPYCEGHRDEYIQRKVYGDGGWDSECADCVSTKRRAGRTPGLFKEEFSGDGIVALNSKTYFCWGEGKSKYSSKGLSKKSNALTKQEYMTVLKDKSTQGGINREFVIKDHKTFTYTQQRSCLTYFYGKRIVSEDGVSTTNTRL